MADNTEGIRQIAIIINTHGVKGELKIIPLTEDQDLFLVLKDLILLNDNQRIRYSIQSARKAKNHWLLRFKEIRDLSKAAELKGQALYTEENNLRPLEEDEFFIDDLIHSKVYSIDGQELGVIVNCLEAGPQWVCEVKTADDMFLFPTSAEILKEVIPPDKVVINLIPELRDLNKKSKKK